MSKVKLATLAEAVEIKARRKDLHPDDGGYRLTREFDHLIASSEANSLSGRERYLGVGSCLRYLEMRKALPNYRAEIDGTVCVIDPLAPDEKPKAAKYIEILKRGEGFASIYEGPPKQAARAILAGGWDQMSKDGREYILEHSSLTEADLAADLPKGDWGDRIIIGATRYHAMEVLGIEIFDAPQAEAAKPDLAASLDLCSGPDSALADDPAHPDTDTGPTM